jgi:hypothetical protein
MRAKKALKRLRRVEELLSIVIDEFAGNEPSVRELLDSAKTSVVRAKSGISFPSASRKPKKQQLKAKQSKRSNPPEESRKRTSLVKERSKRTLEPQIGTAAKSAEERDTPKNGVLSSPMIKPANRPLAPETLPELNADRHANSPTQ